MLCVVNLISLYYNFIVYYYSLSSFCDTYTEIYFSMHNASHPTISTLIPILIQHNRFCLRLAHTNCDWIGYVFQLRHHLLNFSKSSNPLSRILSVIHPPRQKERLNWTVDYTIYFNLSRITYSRVQLSSHHSGNAFSGRHIWRPNKKAKNYDLFFVCLRFIFW